MIDVVLVIYVAGVLASLHRYGRRTDFRGTDDIWRVGWMCAFWPIPVLGEMARWWGRKWP